MQITVKKILSVVKSQLLKVILPLFFACFFLLLATTTSFAAPGDTNCNQAEGGATSEEIIDKINKCAIEKDVFDDKIFNLNQISGTADSLYTLLLGESRLHPEITEVTRGGGAVASASRAVAMLYANPPASGVSYMARQIDKFNPVQPAYAQGVGYSTLAPVQQIWENFRNASYIGFVIIFVIVGFMIMMRAHISPQAVASVQDSLPRIVIALILVTFSYAIAGFVIDLMFVFINFASTLIPLDPAGANKIFEGSVVDVMSKIWDNMVKTGGGAFARLVEDAVGGLPDGIKSIFGFLGGTIAGLVIAVAALFVTFRIFFMLLTAYVSIIVLTIFAPFFFLVQALPGQNGGREWFKQLAGNVSIFATISIMFLFAAYMGGIGYLGGEEGAAVLTGESRKFPLFIGGLDMAAIGKLIGFGFIFYAPEAAKMVKDWIVTGKAQAGGGPGMALGGAMGAAGAGARMGGNFAKQNNPVSDYISTNKAKTQAKREAIGSKWVRENRDDLIQK